MAILDELIHRELLDLYQDLLAKSELRVGAALQRCYDTIRKKFGSERLRDLDGAELLETLHGPGKDSLAYWLEFKNDEEVPSGFGGIAGGGSFKYVHYEDLQQEMNRLAPDVSNSAWGHKYFSLLFPDKLDDYHGER